MRGKIRAGVLGYLVLVVVFASGVLVAWTVIDEAPFHAATGDLTPSWLIALSLDAVVAGLASGWVSRRVGPDRHAVAVLVAILVGLAIVVVLTDLLIGPTHSTRAFLEELFGPMSTDLPFPELWDGRLQTWFAAASYMLAILGIAVGARLAEKR